MTKTTLVDLDPVARLEAIPIIPIPPPVDVTIVPPPHAIVLIPPPIPIPPLVPPPLVPPLAVSPLHHKADKLADKPIATLQPADPQLADLRLADPPPLDLLQAGASPQSMEAKVEELLATKKNEQIKIICIALICTQP